MVEGWDSGAGALGRTPTRSKARARSSTAATPIGRSDGLRVRRAPPTRCAPSSRSLIASRDPGRLPRRVHRRPPTTSRSRSGSASGSRRSTSSPSRGRSSTAGAARRSGTRPSCARRCGPTTSPAARSTWGVNWVGPRDHGVRHRRAEGTPPRRHRAGDVIWCQGFSEPDAGSDLASLTHDGDRRSTAGGGSTVRRSGRRTRAWRSGACSLHASGPSTSEREQARGHHAVPRPDGRRPASRCSRSTARSARTTSTRCSSTTSTVDDDAVLGGVGNGWQVMRHALVVRARRHRALRALRPPALGARGRARRARSTTCPRPCGPPGRARWSRCGSRGCSTTGPSTCRPRVRRPTPRPASHASRSPRPTSWSPRRCSTRSTPRSLRDKRSDAPLHGAVEDHYRYAQAATVASGTIEIQRMIVGRATTRSRAAGS